MERLPLTDIVLDFIIHIHAFKCEMNTGHLMRVSLMYDLIIHFSVHGEDVCAAL